MKFKLALILFQQFWQRLFKALLYFWQYKSLDRQRRGSTLPVFLISGLCLLLINLFFPSAKAYDKAFTAQETRISCRLKEILDGDTITADCHNRYLSIRLTGIDAPEMGQSPWGEQARQALVAIFRRNKAFQLKAHGEDYYQRQLGIVFIRGQEINLLMLEQGQAVIYKSKDTPKHYAAAEKAAKAKGIGIWAEKGLQQNPREWRRQHQD